MELEAFKENLRQLLMAHKLEELFKEVDENLAKRSDLQIFYGILRSRHSRLKIGIGQGTEEKSEADLEMNRIIKGLSDFIDMLEETQIRKTETKDKLESFLSEIEEHKKMLEDSVQENTIRLTRVGQGLIKLGKTIAESPPEESGIPRLLYMEQALKKASRRMKIGYAELEHTYGILLDSFRKLNTAHRGLVDYLDFPDEDLDDEDFEQIKQVSVNLRTTLENINNTSFSTKEFDAVISLADSLLIQEGKLPPEYDFAFFYMNDMKTKSLDVKSYMAGFTEEIKLLNESFKEIFIELELNLQEHGKEV